VQPHRITWRTAHLDSIIAPKAYDAQFCERFEREAKAIGALNPPNLRTGTMSARITS